MPSSIFRGLTDDGRSIEAASQGGIHRINCGLGPGKTGQSEGPEGSGIRLLNARCKHSLTLAPTRWD